MLAEDNRDGGCVAGRMIRAGTLFVCKGACEVARRAQAWRSRTPPHVRLRDCS